MTITIGAEAINRGTYVGFGQTLINKAAVANASGTITSVEIWAVYNNLTSCRVGTFYATNGNTLKCRDSAALATVTQGSKQTITVDSEGTPLAIAVETGDFIGIYFGAGYLEEDSSGYSGVWRVGGEYIDPDDETDYSLNEGDALSLYGTGEEAAVAVGRSYGFIIG